MKGARLINTWSYVFSLLPECPTDSEHLLQQKWSLFSAVTALTVHFGFGESKFRKPVKGINNETCAVLLCLWRSWRSDWHWSATIISTHSLIMVILFKERQSNITAFYLEMKDLCTSPVTDHTSSRNTHTYRHILYVLCVLCWSRSDRLCVCSLKQSPCEICWCLNLWMKRTDRMTNRQESKWDTHTHTHTSWQSTVYIHCSRAGASDGMLASIPHWRLYLCKCIDVCTHTHTEWTNTPSLTALHTYTHTFPGSYLHRNISSHTRSSFQLFLLPL